MQDFSNRRALNVIVAYYDENVSVVLRKGDKFIEMCASTATFSIESWTGKKFSNNDYFEQSKAIFYSTCIVEYTRFDTGRALNLLDSSQPTLGIDAKKTIRLLEINDSLSIKKAIEIAQRKFYGYMA